MVIVPCELRLDEIVLLLQLFKSLENSQGGIYTLLDSQKNVSLSLCLCGLVLWWCGDAIEYFIYDDCF